MNSGNEFKALGLLAGVAFGVLVTLVLLRLINKNRSLKTEYDEMQQMVRGRAYMYGFYTILVFEAIMGIVETIGPIPAEPLVKHFLGIALGVTVQAVYSIWNDAYIGLNTERGRYGITMVFIGLVNFVMAVFAWKEGRMVINGVLQPSFANFLVFLMFVVIGTAFFLKRSAEREED